MIISYGLSWNKTTDTYSRITSYTGSVELTGLVLASGQTLECADAVIRCSGSLDTSAGSSDFGTSQIVMTGSGTIKTGAGQTLYDLLTYSKAVTLGSNIAISNIFAHAGPIIQGAYTVTMTDPTKEYTGLRRPWIYPMLVANIPDPLAKPLLEHIERRV